MVMGKFVKPNFDTGSLECRVTDDEVAIYGTVDGFATLARFCTELANMPDDSIPDHIHLEDYEILDRDSVRVVLAVFPKTKNVR